MSGPLRTPAMPMAFSAWEFLRGLMMAPLVFVPLSPLPWILSVAVHALASGRSDGLATVPVTFLVVAVYAAPWAVGATFVLGAPLGWMLGTVLRPVRRLGWHLLAFAVLGALVGAVTTVVGTIVMFGDQASGAASTAIWAAMLAPVTAAAVAFSWWRTASWSLRADARRAAAAPVDQTEGASI